MYQIDPSRLDLVEEFMRNPAGPHGAELRLLINRLRIMPMADRTIIVCRKRAEEWVVARLPETRGAPVELCEEKVYDDYLEAVREVFRRRWQAVTGVSLPTTPISGPGEHL
jgi:hypothetical protein